MFIYLGELFETYQSQDERVIWLKEKVYGAGTHVTLSLKTDIALRIDADPFLRVQVSYDH